ncbi:MAG: phosphatase PAP2 family protein [Hyphomicrobiaceae bacterium]
MASPTPPTPEVDTPRADRYPDAAGVQTWLLVTTATFAGLLLLWVLLALSNDGGLAGIDASLVGNYVATSQRAVAKVGAIESIARDITSLGSNTFLIFVTVVAAVVLVQLDRIGAASFVLATALTGWIFNSIVKAFFARLRPEAMSITVTTETSSFPSSHAMLAAIVFLTVAVVIARELESRPAAVTVLVTAIVLTVFVGLTRVYLAAHWPSDVLTGWALGSAWVLAAMRLTERPRPPS